MEQTTAKKPEAFQSESSILVHPVQETKPDPVKFPTWTLLVILIVSFFILKSFIYISDKKRHGK